MPTIAENFAAAENALQRTKSALQVSSVAPSLFFDAIRETQYQLDFTPPVRKKLPKFEFATAKSRRWYWWQVSRGAIQAPYRRTNRLREATELQVLRAEPDRFIVFVNVDLTKAPYAPYVIGDLQVPGHRDTGWIPLRRSVSASAPRLARDVTPPFTRNLSGYIVGGQR